MKKNERLTQILRDVIPHGQTQEDLGPRPIPKFSNRAKQRLILRLQERLVVADRLLTVYKALLAVVVLSAIGYLIGAAPPSGGVAAVVSGGFISVAGLLRGLKRIWRESLHLGTIITLLPEVEPEEALKIVKTFYFGVLMKTRSKAPTRHKPRIRASTAKERPPRSTQAKNGAVALPQRNPSEAPT